jgi:hypothetical protein
LQETKYDGCVAWIESGFEEHTKSDTQLTVAEALTIEEFFQRRTFLSDLWRKQINIKETVVDYEYLLANNLAAGRVLTFLAIRFPRYTIINTIAESDIPR